ncbi:MAG: hypothetical protein L6371_04140 [Candidatus Atribacteria bacterium]|nr:hypothetical protein [Candidatus Atribacteria bacterium]
MVHPREIFGPAVELRTAGIILVSRHTCNVALIGIY